MHETDKLNPFSKIEIDTASKLVGRIDPNYLLLDTNQHLYNENIEFNRYFSPQSIREQCYINCTFNKVDFSGTLARNVILKNCSFNHCKFDDSNFKNADFSGSKLYLDGYACSFDFSDFSDVVFYNANFKGCSFSESYFHKTQILNTRFNHSEFESTIFQYSYLEDLDLKQVNLDYSEFSHVKFSNVILPYWSILHVIKGFSEIVNNRMVKFSTQCGTHTVEQSQYIDEFGSMIPYFYNTGDYVALANIYLFMGENEKAYNAILNGLIESGKNQRFRLIKHLSRMASITKIFSNSQLRDFYNVIEEQLRAPSLSYIEYKNCLHELDVAKRLLIDSLFENDSMYIVLQTNISYNDYSKLSFVLENIDVIINENAPSAISYKEVRHNSPIEIAIHVSDIVINLMAVFVMIELLFNKTTGCIEKIQKIMLNHRELKKQDKNNSDIEQLKYKIDELKEKVDQKLSSCKTSLILPGTDEYIRVSYNLSSTYSVPKEMRTYKS